MFESAFKPIGSRTVRGEFEKCFGDSGLWYVAPTWTGGPVLFGCKLHTPRAEVYDIIRTLSDNPGGNVQIPVHMALRDPFFRRFMGSLSWSVDAAG